MSRHNITHFSVRSLQSKSPAAKFNDGVDIVDVLNVHDAVQGHPHVDLPSLRGHCVCVAADEMQLKAGLSYSIGSQVAIGLAGQSVDKEQLCHWVDHPEEAVAFLKQAKFAGLALEYHVSSLDGYLTLPIGSFFTSAGGGSQAVRQKTECVANILAVCKSCLEIMEQDDSVSGNICQRSCNQCKELSEVCNDCESVGYTSADVLFRPCRKCLEADSTCHCLLPLAASADCGILHHGLLAMAYFHPGVAIHDILSSTGC